MNPTTGFLRKKKKKSWQTMTQTTEGEVPNLLKQLPQDI